MKYLNPAIVWLGRCAATKGEGRVEAVKELVSSLTHFPTDITIVTCHQSAVFFFSLDVVHQSKQNINMETVLHQDPCFQEKKFNITSPTISAVAMRYRLDLCIMCHFVGIL